MLIATEGTGYVANSHFHRQLEQMVLRAALPPWLWTAGVRAVWPLAGTRLNRKGVLNTPCRCALQGGMMPSRSVDGIVMEAETIHCITNASGEKALVIAAKNGNERAFETLVERYRGRIIAIALCFTRVEEDAEDAAQLSFQKAYFRLHTFEGKSSFSTWLTRIAINEALMLRRRARKQRQVSIDEHSIEAETGSAGLEIQDSRPDPEASCAQRERARILLAAMEKLRPALRKAIELRELTELSTEETAGHLGISVGAAKARLFHGRRELREVLRRRLRPPRMPRNKAMRATSIASRAVA